jgi:hypothetical protein
MPEVRGKFIKLAGNMMSLYPEPRKKADAVLFAKTGKHWNELDPAEWYASDVYKVFLDTYRESSVTGEKALITLGKKIFPTKKGLGEIQADSGEVVLDVPDHGYDCSVDEGVYLGILKMFDIESGRVEQQRCKKRGDPSCEFHINW